MSDDLTIKQCTPEHSLNITEAEIREFITKKMCKECFNLLLREKCGVF